MVGNIIIYGALSIFFIIITLLFSVAITGHDQRAYSVMDPGDLVEVAGRQLSIEDLASVYQPKVFLRSTNTSPPLLWVWFEAVLNENSVDLVYYHVWENEINPNAAFHKLYSIFRAAYYGFPLYDIEYFQVSISRTSGEVVSLVFETSLGDDFSVTLSEHIVVRYELGNDGKYMETWITRTGDEISRVAGVPVYFDGMRVLVNVQTWNHLTSILSGSRSEYLFLDASLRALSAEDYSKLKFVRKSQGDHRTIENRWTRPLAVLASFLLVTLPAGVIYHFRRHQHSSRRG